MRPDCSAAGHVTLPLLIDIVKKEENLRVRKIAVGLIGELGTEAGDLLKRSWSRKQSCGTAPNSRGLLDRDTGS